MREFDRHESGRYFCGGIAGGQVGKDDLSFIFVVVPVRSGWLSTQETGPRLPHLHFDGLDVASSVSDRQGGGLATMTMTAISTKQEWMWNSQNAVDKRGREGC